MGALCAARPAKANRVIVATPMQFLAVMPESLAAHYGCAGVLCTLQVTQPMRVPDIHLVQRRRGEPSPQAQAFVKSLRAHACARLSGSAGVGRRCGRP